MHSEKHIRIMAQNVIILASWQQGTIGFQHSEL